MDSAELNAWCGALEALVSQPGQTTIDAAFVEPWLLLGGKPAAEEAMHGNKQGVTHILNCCEPWCANGPNFENLVYVGFEAQDEPGYPLLAQHFELTARPFLESARNAGGRCLVHCAMGVNRSAAIVVAYLVECSSMDLLSAVEHVRRARGCILGNATFRAELVSFTFQGGRGARLGDADVRDHWLALRPRPPTPDPSVFGPPPEAWRTLPLVLGGRVRIHQCGEDWAEGAITKLDRQADDEDSSQITGWCVVRLDDGNEDSLPVVGTENCWDSSPDICSIP